MPVLPPKRLQGQTPSHARSRQQEKETAKRTGGHVTKASGALLEKGDVRVRNVCRIENKTTEHASFSVSIDHIAKLEKAVFGSTEIPLMQIELKNGKCNFLVIPDTYLDDIVEALKFYHASKDIN